MDTTFVDIDWCGRPVRIEHAWIAPERRAAPLMVFLHEGLGSVPRPGRAIDRCGG